ncbi:hypothetical protein DW017_10745, partial [Ruminococcus sp. AF37-3AC]
IFFTYYYMSKSANLQVLRTTKKSRSEPSERLLFKLNKKIFIYRKIGIKSCLKPFQAIIITTLVHSF